jgi:hypothetical protein
LHAGSSRFYVSLLLRLWFESGAGILTQSAFPGQGFKRELCAGAPSEKFWRIRRDRETLLCVTRTFSHHLIDANFNSEKRGAFEFMARALSALSSRDATSAATESNLK